MAVTRPEVAMQARTCYEALRNGDRMGQREFHALYEECPEGFSAELVNGIVFVREPTGPWHGKGHIRIGTLLDEYSICTPGVDAFSNASVILSKKDEVQPDVTLRIAPEYGGASTDWYFRKDKPPYIGGAPELLAEVAYSSRAIDMHLKKQRYTAAGVREYLVLCLQPRSLHWFALQTGKQLQADKRGVLKSKVFPGLWLHAEALLTMDGEQCLAVIREGLNSREHAQFIARLVNRQGKRF